MHAHTHTHTHNNNSKKIPMKESACMFLCFISFPVMISYLALLAMADLVGYAII